MKISEKSIRLLAKAVCGDSKYTPYKSGPQLVDFFNEVGGNDVYSRGGGFPSRWAYTEEKLRLYNDKPELKKIIEASVDPREFIELPELDYDFAAIEINKFLSFDKFELKKFDKLYRIVDTTGFIVEAETVKGISHEFIREQISKCKRKIDESDFNGAITNARSLIEAVLIEIIEENEGKEINNDGKIDNLYKRVKKILNLNNDSGTLPPTVIQILSGLDSITTGLAGLSNNSGDRHANKFKTKKHHARLAVNSTLTLVDFLLDSRDYQKAKF